VGGDTSRGRRGSFDLPPDDGTVGERHIDDVLPTGDEEELPRLMARLGRLLEQHGPDGVIVMSREEYERRELAAYAGGWQDASEEYLQRVAAARWEGWLGRWRPLRAVDGPGEVIPFPIPRRPADAAAVDSVHPVGADGADDLPGTDEVEAHRAGSDVPRESPGRRTDSELRRGAAPDPLPIPTAEAHRIRDAEVRRTAPARSPAAQPSLSPKNRRSKAPTIPPLTPQLRKPRTTGDAPEGATE